MSRTIAIRPQRDGGRHCEFQSICHHLDSDPCTFPRAATARAIVYAANVAGIDHVALGSDFDGSTTTGFDTAHIDAVTEALLAAGLSETDIAKVMGGNALRVISAGLVPR